MGYYLMHYGIPRKSGRYPWGSGDRPYQGDGISYSKGPQLKKYSFNKTNANDKTNAGSSSDNTKKGYGEYFRQNIKGGKDRPNQSRAEYVMKNVNNIAKELENARSNMQRSSDRKLKGKSAEGMSDIELRNAINRIQMERTYASLTKPETKSGYVKAEEILSVIGTATSIALSAATIASIAYTMKHPK